MSTMISVEHLTKMYRLGEIGGATLQQDFARWWARVQKKPDPMAKIGQHHARKLGDEFWALNDVNFDVTEGEVVGLIGRNGAGKSTLLKVLSQVTAPTSGQIKLHGRVASLLEVGTGFHPELTGTENIYLNGAILGMTKAEIRAKFDEIVAFSECEAFIDTPVKRYSSGMYVRLAFAVAAHLEPEILVVDEVLAVGDVAFQQKCLGKMRDVSRKGRTILFVSHNLSAVAALCSRAVLLEDGRLIADGDTASVIQAYQQKPRSEPAVGSMVDRPRPGTGRGRFSRIEITAVDTAGRKLLQPVPGCNLVFETTIECRADFAGAQVAVVTFDANRYRVIDVNTALLGSFVTLRKGQSANVRFLLQDVLLKPGVYYIWLWLGRGALEEIDSLEDATTFEVFEQPTAKHTETFPGVYQCRFSSNIDVMPTRDESLLHAR